MRVEADLLVAKRAKADRPAENSAGGWPGGSNCKHFSSFLGPYINSCGADGPRPAGRPSGPGEREKHARKTQKHARQREKRAPENDTVLRRPARRRINTGEAMCKTEAEHRVRF